MNLFVAHLCDDKDREELFHHVDVKNPWAEIGYGTVISILPAKDPKTGDLYFHHANKVRIGLIVVYNRPSMLQDLISRLTKPPRALN